MHARDWVTWHGFALNVATDLRYFDLIVPCGIQAVQMTSLNTELPNATPALSSVAERVAAAAATLFDLVPQQIAESELMAAAHTVVR